MMRNFQISKRPSGTFSALLVSAAILAGAGVLWAHATVEPRVSTPRSYETYTLRVPNEKDVSTTRIEITFPSRVFVVSFGEVFGWDLEVTRDSTGRAVGAVWTGDLPPGRFVQLPFVAVNPSEPGTLVWEIDQTYGDDEVVSWSGPEDSDQPASRTEIVAAADETDDETKPSMIPWVALLIASLAFLLAIKAVAARPS